MTVLAVRLPGLFGSRAFASEAVDLVRHGFQVPHVHAGWIAAQMIQLAIFGNRADDDLISNPVRELHAPSELHPSISSAVPKAHPLPAALGSHAIYPRPEPVDFTAAALYRQVGSGITPVLDAPEVPGAIAARSRGRITVRY